LGDGEGGSDPNSRKLHLNRPAIGKYFPSKIIEGHQKWRHSTDLYDFVFTVSTNTFILYFFCFEILRLSLSKSAYVFENLFIFTARRYASVVYAISPCLSVCLSCLSVCVSVTSRCTNKTVRRRITLIATVFFCLGKRSQKWLIFRCKHGANA